MKREALDLKDEEWLSARKGSCATAQWFSRVQCKYVVEDLDVMHDQPKDDRLGEVFPSNRPHVEHQGFLKEDTVLKNRRPEAQFVS